MNNFNTPKGGENKKMNNKKKGFSKWLLILDYIIAVILLVAFCSD